MVSNISEKNSHPKKYIPLKCICLFIGCVGSVAPVQAQSSFQVTSKTEIELFGVLDASISSYEASGAGSSTRLEPDSNTSSRLGLRGSTDLKDGLKANFWIEAAVSSDNGTGGTVSVDNKTAPTGGGGLTLGRRATFGLQSSWGELRLGRDYVPTFSNLTTSMHPFGTNGAGSSGTMFFPVSAGGTAVRTNVRASNSVGYFLPNDLGGLYGAAMVALGEQTQGIAGANDDGDYKGLRIGYRIGNLNMAGATGKTRYATGDYTQSNFGINYKLGDVKLMVLWGENLVGATKTAANMVGTQWTIGGGEVRFAYTDLKATGVANDANHLALGYVRDLGKGVTWYVTASKVTNKSEGVSGKQFGVNGFSPADKGGSSTGLDVGFCYTF